MRSSFTSSSSEHKKVGIGETVASDDAERFFEPPPSNDDFGDFDDDDEHKKDIFFVVPKHTQQLDCVPTGDDFVDENVDVDAGIVRDESPERRVRTVASGFGAQRERFAGRSAAL